jgi:superfamily II DNA/RNA helicase
MCMLACTHEQYCLFSFLLGWNFLAREQVLVLDEADRILDVGFKKALNAIVSQLPKNRQTLLFSATQTKSVQDLARLSLKDPEYLSVHAESVTATPNLPAANCNGCST